MLNETLESLRLKIDLLDRDILKLLNDRAGYAENIAKIKKSKVKGNRQSYFYQPQRELEVIKKIKERNKGPLKNSDMEFFFRQIMSSCLNLEKEHKIAFLLSEEGLAEAAIYKHFGHAVSTYSVVDSSLLVAQIRSEESSFAIISSDFFSGNIDRLCSLFSTNDIKICAEISSRKNYGFWITRNTDYKNITHVYSTKKSISRCSAWLNLNYPRAKLVSLSDTDKVIDIVLRTPNAAAILNSLSTPNMHLIRLANKISTFFSDPLEFMVLGKKNGIPTANDKTSFIISIKRCSEIGKDLSIFLLENRIKVNCYKKVFLYNNSREYTFYVNCDGHHQDPLLRCVLDILKEEALYFKILGSYPSSS